MENLNILNCKKAGSQDAIAFIFIKGVKLFII